MNDLAHWTRKLQEAERELDAATTRTALDDRREEADACQGRTEAAAGRDPA